MRFLLLLLIPALPAFAQAKPDRAEAERLAGEAQAIHQAGKYAEAIEGYTRAMEKDPTWPEVAALRGQAKTALDDALGGIDDFSLCLELDAKRTPNDPTTVRDCKWLRSLAYMHLNRMDEALADIEWVLNFEPGYRQARRNYADMLVQAGEIERAEEEIAKADPADPGVPLSRFVILELKADWAGMEKLTTEIIQKGGENSTIVLYRVFSLVEQGRLQQADELARVWWAKEPSNHSLLALFRVVSTSSVPGFDPQDAFRWYRAQVAQFPPHHSLVAAEARALVQAGQFREAVEMASSRSTFRTFEVAFWHGAALWKLDRLAEAREVFQEARRKNTRMMAHAPRVPGIDEFLRSIDGQVAADLKAVKEQRKAKREEVTRILTVAESESRAKRFEFERAAKELLKLKDTLESPQRKAELEERAKELQAMAAMFKRVVEAAGKAKPPLQVKIGDKSADITRADAAGFEFKVATATGKQSWAALDARAFASLAQGVQLPPQDQFALGILLWDAGQLPESWKALDASVRTRADLRDRLNALIARRRGVEVPPGGFVFFRNQWVTPVEKTNLEKGLVRYEGEWVPSADVEQLSKGMKKVGNGWATREEADLIGRGYRKEGNRWMSPQESEEFHSKWENAWAVETAHYKIRTTQSEAFAKDLGALLEVAYPEFLKYWGGRPPKLDKGEKMLLNAYRDFEDYRRYCVERKAESMINAAGFAQADSKTVVGWNKTGSLRHFLQTMVHEAAHLYYWRAVGFSDPPSWLAEAMATWFEGFEWTGKEWVFTWNNPERQQFARDCALANTHVPFAQIAKTEAGKLINEDHARAIAFYGQVWSMNQFLMSTDNAAYRKAYEAYRKDAEKGKTDPLEKYFKDLKQLEADWKRHVTGK